MQFYDIYVANQKSFFFFFFMNEFYEISSIARDNVLGMIQKGGRLCSIHAREVNLDKKMTDVVRSISQFANGADGKYKFQIVTMWRGPAFLLEFR